MLYVCSFTFVKDLLTLNYGFEERNDRCFGVFEVAARARGR